MNLISGIQKTYLAFLYSKHRLMFFFVITFIFLQMFFTWKGVETIPFFSFGMYSAPHDASVILKKYVIKFDGKEFLLEKNSKQIATSMVEKNLRLYQLLIDSNTTSAVPRTIKKRFGNLVNSEQMSFLVSRIWNDRQTIEKFPCWLKVYFHKRLEQDFNSLTVQVKYFQWIENEYSCVRTEPLFECRYEQ